MQSVSRIRIASVRPPRKPAVTPTATPMTEHQKRGKQTDRNRHLTAIHQADQLIAAKIVGAKPMLGARGLEPRQQVGLVRIDPQILAERPCREADQGQHDQKDQRIHGQTMAAKLLEAKRPD